jgi:hypothetical protein
VADLGFDLKVFAVNDHGGRFGRGPIEDCIVNSIRWDLYGAGSAQIAFDPLARNAQFVKLLEREIQIWFDDELMWWGVPLRDNGDLRIVNIECEGLFCHFRDRIVDDATLLYTSIDQLNIAWHLISFAQNESTQAHRDFNISAAAFAPSGKVRSREYKREEHAIIFDLLMEFPTLADGFDHEIVADATGQRFWTPYYPRKERTLSDHKLVLTVDRDRGIEGFQWQSDATTVATHAYATGGSSGDVKFEENYEDVAASAKYKVRQRVISEGAQNDVSWLLERAQREVSERKEILRTPTVSVAPAPKDWFRIVRTGDWLPVLVDYGYYQLAKEHRIGSVEWTPTATNLTFIEERDAA